MKFDPKVPARLFSVGSDRKVVLKDCGSLRLEPDELVTFTTDSGSEYDVTRKEWGFYATPSLNQRLQRFDLRAVLVKNRIGHFFVLLQEKGKESFFHEYLVAEQLQIVCWMDTTENLQRLSELNGLTDYGTLSFCPICGSPDSETIFTYTLPPKGEIISQPDGKVYFREVVRCNLCHHFRSTSPLDPATLYSGTYVNSNYKDMDGIRAAFERIIALPPEDSDNAGRVRRVLDFTLPTLC